MLLKRHQYWGNLISVFLFCVFLITSCANSQKMGEGSASVFDESANNVNPELVRCAEVLGAIVIIEDTDTYWSSYLRSTWELGPISPVLTQLIGQSMCFDIVELEYQTTSVKNNKNIPHGDNTTAQNGVGTTEVGFIHYTMSPSVLLLKETQKKGLTGALSDAFDSIGILIRGGLDYDVAHAMLMLTDNSSGVQLAAAEGSAEKVYTEAMHDYLINNQYITEGYSSTVEGRLLVAAFTDSFNKMIRTLQQHLR